jgi:Pirin C-terminal cupin domain
VTDPVGRIPVDPTYLDVRVPPHETFDHPTHPGYTAFVHAIYRSGEFGGHDAAPVPAGGTALFGPGDAVTVRAEPYGSRFLLVAGGPLHVPVARDGPIVMNTRAELQTALRELNDGPFIHDRRPIVDEWPEPSRGQGLSGQGGRGAPGIPSDSASRANPVRSTTTERARSFSETDSLAVWSR